ncbi:MAG: hypothetical protein JRI85_17535 [Deltaproteobacteria bacterium]|nr:hypothetical protein [Deltaproteobacteria bacterium]
MSKKQKNLDNKNQLSIFDFLRDLSTEPEQSTEGRYRVIDRLRASLRQAIKASPLSRHQIAGEMSHLLGETLTKEMIDSWTRQSDEINGRPGRHIPAEYLPAFCQVTRSNDPLVILGQLVGLFVLPGPEALRAEIQKLDEQINKAKAKKRKRVIFLKEMEKDAT